MSYKEQSRPYRGGNGVNRVPGNARAKVPEKAPEKESGWNLIAVVAAAILAVSTVLSFVIPYLAAESAIPEGELLTLREQEDGMLLLEWPAVEGAVSYSLELLAPGTEGQGDYSLFQAECEENRCLLRSYPDYPSLLLRLRPRKGFQFLLWQASRRGETMEVSGKFYPPRPRRLRWTSDPSSGTVFFLWEPEEGTTWRLYEMGRNDTLRLLDFPENTEAELRFTTELNRPYPTQPGQYRFALDAYREEGRLAAFGQPVEFTVGSENFGDRNLNVIDTDLGGNVHLLSWNDARAKGYRLQRFDEAQGVWETVASYEPGDASLSYQTEQMAPYTSCRYRVLALGSTDPADLWYTVEPTEVEVKAGASVIFTTVWPLWDISYYASAEDWQPAGTLSAEGSYTVVGASSDRFLIRLESGNTAWVDCRQCLMNAPDFLGDLCLYDIRNSYSADYTVHEYAIPGVTGTALEGYGSTRTLDGSYLVPVYYPTLIKLKTAAELAAAEGLRLSIRDAFQPETATRYLYTATSAVSQSPLPSSTYTGRTFSSLPDPGNGQPLSYGFLMTSGTLNLNSFLAPSDSYHNYGAALDLTLTLADGSQEPVMQTLLHDLSWYSSTDRNTESADTLRRLMTAAGFAGVDSEWWHFQDEEARWSGNLRPRWSGVTLQGWRGGDRGWRYRLGDGSYYAGVTVQIGGVYRTFDGQGYLAS